MQITIPATITLDVSELLKNVRSYLRQAVRCEECLKGEVKDEDRN